MRVVVATHGHCFDGLSSAVLFTRLLKELEGPRPEFSYRACGYGMGQKRPTDALLSGDQNAILDYRFLPSQRLTWYFDHHRTAFASEADRRVFDGRIPQGRYFFDAECSSCTKLLARVAAERFGLRDERLDELVHWADIVDSAAFESAEQAVSRSDPILRFVSVVEHHGDSGFISQLVPQLLERPLAEVAGQRRIAELYRPIGEKHERFVERVRQRGELKGRVVLVDLTDRVLDTIGKFVTYALFPTATYSVVVALLKHGAKISVGYNPWAGRPLDTDISAICARYGGGGHAVVGGIPFKVEDLEKARLVAREIAAELGA